SENGALFKKRPILQVLLPGSEQRRQAVGQLCKGSQEKREKLHRIVRRKPRLVLLDQGVELFRRGKTHFTGTARLTFRHTAAVPGKMEGTAGTVFYLKTQTDRFFKASQNFPRGFVQAAQIFQG